MAQRESTYQFRYWKSSTGKYKIYAQLIRHKDGKVKLRQDTGKIVNVAVEKLSRFDREYLESLAEDNPFANAEESDSEMGSDSAQYHRVDKLIRSLNSAQTKLVDRGEWLVEPDPYSRHTAPLLNTPLTFRKKLDKQSPPRVADVSVDITGQFMGVVRYDGFEDVTELTTFDLASGKAQEPIEVPTLSDPHVAVTPDGKHAAVFRGSSGKKNGQIDFIRFEPSSKVIASWQLSDFFHHGGEPFEPKQGIFISNDRLLTIDRAFAGVWDWKRADAIFAFEIDSFTNIAVSPTGKQLAVQTKSGSTAVLDSESGKVQGVLAGKRLTQAMAFSPNGRFLAGVSQTLSTVWIYDLTKNQIDREIGSSTSFPRIKWIGNEYLLVNDSELIDIALGAVVWKYKKKGIGELVGTNDGKFWFVTNKKITPIELITPKIRTELSKLEGEKLDPADLKLLKKGAEISVQLDVPFDDDKKLEIRNNLVEKLESRGLVIRDDADIKLTLNIIDEKEEELTVSSIFSMPRMPPMPRVPGIPNIPRPRDLPGFPKEEPDEKVTSHPKTGSIILTHENRLLWKKTRRFGPFGSMLHRREGETSQQAIDRLCTVDPQFFINWELPDNHAQLPSGEPLGSSTISADGIQ